MKTAVLIASSLLLVGAAVAGPSEVNPDSSGPDEAVVQWMIQHTTNIDSDVIRKNYNTCDSGYSWSMKICASYRWHSEDLRLNRLYKRAIESAGKNGSKASLIRSQRAWIAYRDATCLHEEAVKAQGGSDDGLYFLSCNQSLTKARAMWIEEQLLVSNQSFD